MNYQIHPEAQAEVERAGEHYERERAGLGHEFADEYDRSLADVLANPTMYPPDEDGPPEVETRYRLLHRFPYRIIYTARDTGVYILAVAHTSQRPGYWQARLNDPPAETT